MARRLEFEPYTLSNLRVTNEVLGTGSYASIVKVEYHGLECTGKQIHEILLQQEDMIERFEKECYLLSQVRHPNIVQFLGIYFPPGSKVPILVMEFIPTDLTKCIEQYGLLPKEIGYSILYDVALGLHYLHSQNPSIFHRDLSSNNVLLTANLTAKIADLGVARIFDLSSLQVNRLTRKPGTQDFMPPEALSESPEYTTSMDIFSYGIMAIHILSGKWPYEQKRHQLFQNIKDPLQEFIQKCIDVNPHYRATSVEIVECLKHVVSKFPTNFADKIVIIKEIESDKKELMALKLRNEGKEVELKKNVTELANLTQDYTSEIVRLKLLHSIDIAIKDAKVRSLSSLLEEKKRLVQQKDEDITLLIDQLTQARKCLSADRQPTETKIIWKECAKLPLVMCNAQSTVIKGKVYVGGGTVSDNGNKYLVYLYDPSQDEYTTLPQAPVRYFGIGQVNNQLVTVGGMKRNDRRTNELYTFNESVQEWQQNLPSMPTEMVDPAVFSFESVLVVCSNIDQGGICNSVDILKSDTKQWYKTDPLPAGQYSMSTVAIGNKCYITGGLQEQSRSKHAFYATVDDLLRISASTTEIGSSIKSAWKVLPSSPSYQPAAIDVAGNICIAGGRSAAIGGNALKEVYIYSPDIASWVHISDLPVPQSDMTVAVLSQASFLVIGGRDKDGNIVNTVYKGTVYTIS